jgi:hypothetical protein
VPGGSKARLQAWARDGRHPGEAPGPLTERARVVGGLVIARSMRERQTGGRSSRAGRRETFETSSYSRFNQTHLTSL